MCCFFFQAEDGIRDLVRSRGLGDVYKRQYLHRIVTNPAFRGRNFVQKIVAWSKNQARTSGKKYIRLDTWSDNPKLKELYLQCGFQFLGNQIPANPAALPIHYSTITLGMFELAVD